MIFLVTRKKNNVSDADREIPTLGSTDNAGNSISLVSGFPRVGISRAGCIGD